MPVPGLAAMYLPGSARMTATASASVLPGNSGLNTIRKPVQPSSATGARSRMTSNGKSDLTAGLTVSGELELTSSVYPSGSAP